MKTPWFAILALIPVGCAAGPASKVPAGVTAIGVATDIRDVSLARSASKTRAMRNLAMQLEPHALSFSYRATGEDAELTVKFVSGETGLVRTEFEKLPAGWICYAHATRSPGTIVAMEKLDIAEVRATVTHGDPRVSLPAAQSRAFRTAIARHAPPGVTDIHMRGAITLIEMQETLTDEGASVQLKAHVRIDSVEELAVDKKNEVIRAALEEHEQLEDWPRAVTAYASIMALSDPDASDYARLGGLLMKAAAPAEAAKAYARAAELEPDNPDHLRRQLEAAGTAKIRK